MPTNNGQKSEDMLKTEYSLIAIPMYKQKDCDGNRRWTDVVQIEKYIKRIAHYGEFRR